MMKKGNLEDLMGRKVDVMTPESLSPYILREEAHVPIL
jgi:predicted nucleotidyltransferase